MNRIRPRLRLAVLPVLGLSLGAALASCGGPSPEIPATPAPLAVTESVAGPERGTADVGEITHRSTLFIRCER